MDFLNKAFAQIADLFRSMSVASRITTGLLLVVVVVSLVYLVRYSESGGGVYLMDGQRFTPQEMDAMEAAFADAQLQGALRDDNRIRVPRGQQASYMAALVQKNAMPGNAFRYLEASVNTQGSIFEDKQQKEERRKIGKQQHLSSIIKRMKGIQDAVVGFEVEPKPGSLNRETTKTAWVSLQPIGSQPLEESLVRNIRHFVAAAFAGMKPENVTVQDLNGAIYSGGTEGSGGYLSDQYAEKKRQYEQEYGSKIRHLLSDIKGVLVSVNVDLSNERVYRERETKHDGKPVVISSTEKTRSHTRDGATTAGRAGFAANSPAALPPTQGKGLHDEEEESSRQDVNAVGSRETEKEYIGAVPKSVQVAVRIPRSHFEKIWQEQNTPKGEKPKTPQSTELDAVRSDEILKIQQCIAPLVRTETTTDTSKLIQVVEFQDIPAEPIPEPQLQERVLDWLVENWSTLGLIFLGLVSLLMLRSMVRSAPASRVSAAAPVVVNAPVALEAEKEETLEKEENSAERRLKRLSGTGMSLRDELSELVTEDPDGAANILRTWIGSAT